MNGMDKNGFSEAERARITAAIEARVAELKIDWQDIPDRDGPSTAKVREFVNGRSHVFSRAMRRKLERALEWEAGSFEEVAKGGDPTPIFGGVALPETPSVGDINAGPGLRPGSLSASLVLSTRERQILARVRNKLVDQSALTPEETSLLTKFVEDEELRTLHVRIDWLPRAEQLEVSALVNDLHMRIENRRIVDGPGLVVPDYAVPNPLPRDGIAPDQLEEEEDEYAVSSDQTTPTGTSTEARPTQEASLNESERGSISEVESRLSERGMGIEDTKHGEQGGL
jgi:hypothetical protein